MPDPAVSQSSPAPRMNTRTVVCYGMLTAIAYVVMWLSKLMPSVMFLDFDFKDVVICIGGFIYGPMAAAIISVLVAFIEFITISNTGVWGFLMNAIATCSFCCTAAFLYKKLHTKWGAVISLACGVAALAATMVVWNYLITPIYMVGTSRAQVAAMIPTLFLPFNLAKGGMNMAATLLLYKPVVTALRSAGLAPASRSGQARKTSPGFLLFSLALLATFVTFALVLAGVI